MIKTKTITMNSLIFSAYFFVSNFYSSKTHIYKRKSETQSNMNVDNSVIFLRQTILVEKSKDFHQNNMKKNMMQRQT